MGIARIAMTDFFIFFILQEIKTKKTLMYKSSKYVTKFLPYQEADDLNHLQDLFNISLDLMGLTLLTCE